MNLSDFGYIYFGIYLCIGFVMAVVLYSNDYVNDISEVGVLTGMWPLFVILFLTSFMIDKVQ